MANQRTVFRLTPDQWEDTYHTVFNSQIFFIPLVIIVTSYVKIFLILTRYKTKNAAGILINSLSEEAMQFLEQCLRHQSLARPF